MIKYLNLTEGTDGKGERVLLQLLINICKCPKRESQCNFHVRRSYAFDDTFKFFNALGTKRKRKKNLLLPSLVNLG